MHIVYKICFLDRKKNSIYPYQYIGSKSNCSFDNGLIIDKKGNMYFGSSTWDNYDSIVNDNIGKISIKVLWQSDDCDYNELIQMECELQNDNDCVAAYTYFNKALATISNYSDPDYATYKHTKTGKVVRLKTDHPMVECGEYRGITYGSTYTDDRKKHLSKINTGSNNKFYGKAHSKKTKSTIGNKNRGRIKTKKELENISKTFKGVPKTEEHKEKIGKHQRNKSVIKNSITGECLKIYTRDRELYSRAIWKSPYALADRMSKCLVCGYEGSEISIKRWHNDRCGSNSFYNPWSDKKFKSQEFFLYFEELICYINKTITDSISMKRYNKEYLVPFITNLGFEYNKSIQTKVNEINKANRNGLINDQSIESFRRWKEVYENQKH